MDFIPMFLTKSMSKTSPETMGKVGGPLLPDFRNIGVVLRLMLLCALAFVLTAYLVSSGWSQAIAWLLDAGFMLASLVLCMLVLLFIAAPWLSKQAYPFGVAVIILLAMTLSAGMDFFLSGRFGHTANPGRAAFLAGLLSAGILAYFDHRQRVLSPALAQARLMALQARIRPHFLFNSLNTVVSVVRRDPRLAEHILLDLSDLFRALLAEARGLVALSEEIRLARAYLDIESMRLGPRLQIEWKHEAVPEQARVPTLILQPLLENAIHHGIEPSAEGGVVQLEIRCIAKRLYIRIANPVPLEHPPSRGNGIALANIEERLMLHFDAEAQMRCQKSASLFVVEIEIPLVIREGR
jgi:two-component system, LytTR family, sensor histidine kinase AlgZ